MRKRKIPLPFALGMILILCGLGVMLFFGVRSRIGGEKCRQVVEKMAQLLPERTPGLPGMSPDPGMPVLEIEGTDYVAQLEIPAFGITLPVADKWDSGRLSYGPARFWGSAYDGTLVIGGGDDPRQFGFCDKIEHGAVVTVTDMIGTQFAYTVSDVDRAGGAKTEWLADADCDLTLFCHDLYSMEYIAVRCVFAFN